MEKLRKLSRRDLFKAVGALFVGAAVGNEARQEVKINAEVTEREMTDEWVLYERNNSLIRDRQLYGLINQTRTDLGLEPLIPGQLQPKLQEPQELLDQGQEVNFLE